MSLINKLVEDVGREWEKGNIKTIKVNTQLLEDMKEEHRASLGKSFDEEKGFPTVPTVLGVEITASDDVETWEIEHH